MPNPVSSHGSRRRLAGLVLLMTAACGAVGQTSPATSGYRIAGIVVNAATDEPVRHAMVAALNEEDSHTVASVESGEDGRFSLDGLAAAKYQLMASKRGFRTAAYDEHEEFSTAVVTGPGQETEDLRFRIMPGSTLRGVVTTDGGDPVENATVMLFLKPHAHRVNDRITQANSTTTDDTGAYEFNGLEEGDYIVAVKADPWYAAHSSFRHGGSSLYSTTEMRSALDVAYPVTFYDETTDESSATTIALAGGNREEANVTLHAVPALHLTVDTSRKPDGGPGRAELRQSIFGVQIPSGVNGGFADRVHGGIVEFGGLAPGHYELVQGDPPRIAELDPTTSQQVDPLLGTPTFAVSGTLRNSAGALLCGPDSLTNLTIEAVGANPRSPIGTNCNRGEFNFQGVPSGNWRLSVQSQSGQLPVATIVVGNRAHAGDEFTVGDRPVTLTVAVSEAATRIMGFARKNGKGKAGVMVVLVPADLTALTALARRDQSDSDGSFSLRNVVPGRYTVVAIEDGWPLDWSQPEVIARYLPGGFPVTVTSSSGKLLTLSGPVPVESREP
ncbi:MAG: carboxypeptidase-like regulatory domain-containing protein [Terracidiphilus sp.]|jgi:hypothetical protein